MSMLVTVTAPTFSPVLLFTPVICSSIPWGIVGRKAALHLLQLRARAEHVPPPARGWGRADTQTSAVPSGDSVRYPSAA